MIGAILTAWKAIKSARSWLTLIALAAAAAALYAWGATGRADRDRLLAWAERNCAVAGAPFPAEGKLKRGIACQARIAQLVRFERDTNAESAKLLAQTLADQNRKAAIDAATARNAAAAARLAAENMERTNAQVGEDGRVDGRWFDDLNRLGGLRPPAH